MSTNTLPLVTIIAVCYNHSRFVTECLDSILSQTYPNIELVIMDDCSTDNSVELIQEWIAKYSIKCKFIPHEKNVGLCKTLNEALSYAHGEFVSIVATDDIYLPHKTEKQMAIMLEKCEQVAVVYSDAIQINENGETLPNTFFEDWKFEKNLPSGRVLSRLIDGNIINAPSTLIRKSSIYHVGGYDERLVYEDYDMWLRLSEKFDFVCYNEVVVKYRIVSTSMTRSVRLISSPHYAYTQFLIYEKWLSSDQLSQTQYKKWSEEQWGAAYYLYVHGDYRSRLCLWKCFFRNRKMRCFLLAIACTFGLSRTKAKQLTSLIFHGKIQCDTK